MDGNEFSAIGHRGMAFWNPVGGAIIDDWIDGLSLSPTAKVLDVGCGRAELLRRMHQRHACACIGIDPSPSALDGGVEKGSTLPTGPPLLELRRQDFRAGSFRPAEFDVIACIGSTHAVGDTAQCLQVLGGLLQAGGRLWLGIGYWRREPDVRYLHVLRCRRDEMLRHDGNMALFREHGWRVERHHLTSTEEWATYEDTFDANIRRHIAAHPDDPNRAAMQERIDAWRRAYLRWGRTTLGFGLYQLRSPRRPEPGLRPSSPI